MTYLLLVISILMSACTAEPLRQFNLEDYEDPACLRAYGAQKGYCWGKQTI